MTENGQPIGNEDVRRRIMETVLRQRHENESEAAAGTSTELNRQLAAQQAAQQQPRTQNGQFSFTSHREQTPNGQVNLPTLDLWEASGTFSHPPRPANADDVLRFWSTVDIPDEELDRFALCGRQRYFELMMQKAAHWRVHHPYSPAAETREQYDARTNAEIGAAIKAAEEKIPSMIPDDFTRPLLRIAKMDEAAKQLPEQERRRVGATLVRLPGGESRSLGIVCDHWRTDDLLKRMRQDRDNRELAASLQAQQYLGLEK